MADEDIVTLTVDEVEVKVPKGANLIEAAKKAGVEVPHYCYHGNLKVAGNCRMCQMKVEGVPKLLIGCNTLASQGMKVSTHKTSLEVADAQRSTLEFLLLNHPIDCTVCDQAGHCKLQDYYMEYNSKSSRFLERKNPKVKAKPLGKEVIYDGERCILCTRCVRFVDDVVGTSELGVFNRGAKSVIGVAKDKPLNNPFSSTVVDLCPVGALTHRRWRFNSRIWFSKSVDSICGGCSTGCNVKVFTRDREVINVKAKNNQEVNKDWLCDEGRYGFMRMEPEERLISSMYLTSKGYEKISKQDALRGVKEGIEAADGGRVAVLISPFLPLEDLFVLKTFTKTVLGVDFRSDDVCMQGVNREITDVEKILISEDYAPNISSSLLFKMVENSKNWREELNKKYNLILENIKSSKYDLVFIVGDGAILNKDIDFPLIERIRYSSFSIQLLTRLSEVSKENENVGTLPLCSILLPSTTFNEKSGTFINKDFRAQKLNQIFNPLESKEVLPEWKWLIEIAQYVKKPLYKELPLNEGEIFSIIKDEIKEFKDVIKKDIF